jgi:hypothetical protein
MFNSFLQEQILYLLLLFYLKYVMIKKGGVTTSMNKTIIIIVGAVMALFIGVIIYSSVANRPEPPPEVEEPCENTVVIAGTEYKISETTSLTIEWVALTRDDMQELSRLVNLTRLELKVCEITNINALSRLANLTHLDLRFNNITELAALESLANLTYLNLSHNNITNVQSLEFLTRLTELNLASNDISDISALYGRLPNLRNLYLYDNAKNEEGIDVFDERTQGAVLRGQFPGAAIHF